MPVAVRRAMMGGGAPRRADGRGDVTPRSATVRSAAMLASALLVLAACAATGAAEPAAAPHPDDPPAGRVVHVGDQPEGVAADPVSHLVAVGVRNPDGLALVDGRTGALVRRIPLPGHLRHLQLASPGGPLLVPDESSGALLTVTLPGGEVQSRVPVGKYPHDAAQAADGTVVVADELGRAVVFLRGSTVAHRFTDVRQPGGVAATGPYVAVVDVYDHRLDLYRTDHPARLARVPAGDGPSHVVADRQGRLYVTDTRDGVLLTYDTTPRLHRIATTTLPGNPYGIAYDAQHDRLWVTLTALNKLVEFDVSGSHPRPIGLYPTVRQPNTVGVDAATGRVFVASRTDGTLELVDP